MCRVCVIFISHSFYISISSIPVRYKNCHKNRFIFHSNNNKKYINWLHHNKYNFIDFFYSVLCDRYIWMNVTVYILYDNDVSFRCILFVIYCYSDELRTTTIQSNNNQQLYKLWVLCFKNHRHFPRTRKTTRYKHNSIHLIKLFRFVKRDEILYQRV